VSSPVSSAVVAILDPYKKCRYISDPLEAWITRFFLAS
jgi:hypothetical protein